MGCWWAVSKDTRTRAGGLSVLITDFLPASHSHTERQAQNCTANQETCKLTVGKGICSPQPSTSKAKKPLHPEGQSLGGNKTKVPVSESIIPVYGPRSTLTHKPSYTHTICPIHSQCPETSVLYNSKARPQSLESL